ncbi:MAG: carboxypeptidase regulatory-like domain-containing protein, partial [Myxococcota bacterium]
VASGDPGEKSMVVVRLEVAPPIEGQVLTAEGYPAVDALVRCTRVIDGEALTAQTDADGRFVLSPSAVGCELVATAPGAGPSQATTARPGAALVLRLRDLSSIAGVVVGGDGAGVGGATVSIERYVPPTADATAGSMRRSVRTLGEGSFLLGDLPPGRYVLSALTETTPPAKSEPIELGAGERRQGVRIVVAEGGEVDGRVSDAESGRPVAGAQVRLQGVIIGPRSVPATVETDEDGRFTLVGVPEETPFSIRTEAPGYNIRLTAGLTVKSSVSITLNPADGPTRKEVPTTGIYVRAVSTGLEVTLVEPSSTADKAGVLPRDLIRTIDGRSTEFMTPAEGLQYLRGEPGTSVSLAIERDGVPRTIRVERELLLK